MTTLHPWNLEKPFTDEDIARYNAVSLVRLTSASFNAGFVRTSNVEREIAAEALRRVGIDTVHVAVEVGLEAALERQRKARFRLFEVLRRYYHAKIATSSEDRHSDVFRQRMASAETLLCRGYDEINAASALIAKRLTAIHPAAVRRTVNLAEVAMAQNALSEAKRQRARMLEANDILQKEGVSATDKLAQLQSRCGVGEALAAGLMRPDSQGRVGYPDYALLNQKARIGRLEEVLADAQRPRLRDAQLFDHPKGTIEDCAETGMIRVFRVGKEAREDVERLSAHGFLWMELERCWLRSSDQAARDAVTRVTGVQWPNPDTPEIDAVAEYEARESAPTQQDISGDSIRPTANPQHSASFGP